MHIEKTKSKKFLLKLNYRNFKLLANLKGIKKPSKSKRKICNRLQSRWRKPTRLWWNYQSNKKYSIKKDIIKMVNWYRRRQRWIQKSLWDRKDVSRKKKPNQASRQWVCKKNRCSNNNRHIRKFRKSKSRKSSRTSKETSINKKGPATVGPLNKESEGKRWPTKNCKSS